MSDIQIKIASNPKRESVFINPRIAPLDKVEKIMDENGKVIGAKVTEQSNVVAFGTNRREALKTAYGR